MRTQRQLAPVGELAWEDFERLCLALARRDGEPEHCQLYGVRGQAQEGIDLYARHGDGSYAVYQCKRVQQLDEDDLAQAVDRVRSGSWWTRASRIVFCTSLSAVRTQMAEAIERHAGVLREQSKSFAVWDAEELSQQLKEQPRIVLDFFGRSWVEEFCTVPLPESVAGRLDVDELAVLRDRLRRFYRRLFGRYDVLAGSEQRAPQLAERFVVPDVVRRRHLAAREGAPAAGEDTGREAPRGPSPPRFGPATLDTLLDERVGAAAWLGDSRQALLLGGAGSGKSSLLRWLCLDLLDAEPTSEGLGAVWEGFLAVWVPFGRWVQRIADGERELSLGGLLEGFFASYDERDLWELVREGLHDMRLLLLVDGLDEWTHEGAAVVAGERLQQLVAMRGIPALLCGRREGVRALGSLDPEWSVAELAPLDGDQRARLLTGLGANEQQADAFLTAVERIRGLRALTGNPLLLTLLWALDVPPHALPQDRWTAIDRFIAHLISDQPRLRRQAAGIPSPLTLPVPDIETALARLGLAAQQAASAPQPRPQARALLARHLADRDGARLSTDEAAEQAGALLDEAEGAMGLLARGEDAVVFAHRALQEQLAARALAAMPTDTQQQVAREHAADPAWGELLLGLLRRQPDAEAADALVAALRAGAAGKAANWAIAPLLARAAFHPFICSQDARARLSDDAVRELDDGSWMPALEAVLDVLLDGVDDPQVGHRVRQAARSWLPGRSERAAPLFAAMREWPDEPQTEETLWRALRAEDTATARQAARSLLARVDADPAAADHLAEMLDMPLDARTRAVALEALAAAWPTHPALEQLIPRARQSASTDLRQVALTHLVATGQHARAELDELLHLADGWTHVDFDRKGEVGATLMRGWPRDEEIKRLCLRTSESVLARDRELDPSLALAVLLQGYPGDLDVAAFCERQIRGEEYPFLLLHYDAWPLLVAGFRDNPGIVVAVDEWLPRQQHNEPEMSGAALIGRTETARRRLLQLLREEPATFVFWPYQALREGWSDDQEVGEALRALALAPAERAGNVAHLLDGVLPEPQRRTRLLTLLGDPANPRPARAALGLAGCEDRDLRQRALQLALERGPSGHWRRDEELRDVLIADYADLPASAELALRELGSPTANLGALARAATVNEELRCRLREIACPLPSALRSRLAQRLFEGVAADESARQLTAGWRLEANGMAAAAMASAHVRRSPREAHGELREQAAEALHGPRLAREAEPQAGLAAVLELRGVFTFAEARLRHMPERTLDVGLKHGANVNWWLAFRVAAHFESLRAELGETLADRLTEMSDVHGMWESLAPFAHSYEPVRAAALRFIREHGHDSRPQLLRFLAAERPGSEELLDALLDAVHDTIVDRSPARDALLLSADLLAEQFAGDRDPPHTVRGRLDAWPRETRLLVLAMGWPRSERLRAELDAHNTEEGGRLPDDIALRLHLALSEPQQAAEELSRWLPYAAEQAPYLAPLPRVLLLRLSRDADFVAALSGRIVAPQHDSEQATFARLLSAVGQLRGPARDVVEQRCERALDGKDIDVIVFDLLSAAVRPLGIVLLEALRGEN